VCLRSVVNIVVFNKLKLALKLKYNCFGCKRIVESLFYIVAIARMTEEDSSAQSQADAVINDGNELFSSSPTSSVSNLLLT